MRFLARTFLLLLFALPFVTIVAVWLCFQDAPSVVRSVRLTPQDIENAKRIVAKHEPRKSHYSGARTAVLSEQELDLLLNYAANRFGNGAARTIDASRPACLIALQFPEADGPSRMIKR